MASLIDRIAYIDATLRVPTGEYDDGEPLFEDLPCRVFQLGGERRGEEQYGQILSQRVFLMASDIEKPPALPGRIVVDNVEYSIQAAKPYTSMQGVLQGYRVEVANA